MKKIFAFALTLILAINSLAACGKNEAADSGSTTTAPNANTAAPGEPAGSTPKPESTPEQGGEAETPAPAADGRRLLFKSAGKPVAACENRFIVRNETGNLYALVDESGSYIMPLEYGAMSFEKTKRGWVVKAMSKGSFGVFDMDGNNLIPCEYTEIGFNEYFDCCTVKDNRYWCGAVGLDGKVIVDMKYSSCEFNNSRLAGLYDGVVAISFSGETAYAISSSGDILDEWEVERELLDGKSVVIPQVTTVVWGEYLFYCLRGGNGEVMMKNLSTGEERELLSCPEQSGQKIHYTLTTTINNGYSDAATGLEHIVLIVKGAHTWVQVDCAIADEFQVVPSQQYWFRIGSFHGDRLPVYTGPGKILIVDKTGERIKELNIPFSNCTFLANSILIENNGYYSIVDYDGNAMLSESGYSGASNKGLDLYLLTDHNGKMALINGYAEEMIPMGKVADKDSCIVELGYLDPKEYVTKVQPRYSLRILHTADNTWGVYSADKHGMLMDFIPFEDGSMELYNCFAGNGGYVLESDDASRLFTVEDQGDGFALSLFAEL